MAPFRSSRHTGGPRRGVVLVAGLVSLLVGVAALTVGPAAADGLPDPASPGTTPHITASNDHAMGSTIPESLRRRWSVTSAPAVSALRPGGNKPQGVDVSHHNGYIDWGKVAAAGIDFAIIKATEGTSFTDPRFDHNYPQSYQHGIIRGAYHFANPAGSSGAAQARFFVSNGGGWSADGLTLPPMLDIEYNPSGPTCYGLTHRQMIHWVTDFSETMKRLTNRYPMIYSTTDWWVQCTGNYGGLGDTSPLVIAKWGSKPLPLPDGWPYWTIWQYTDKGRVNGIDDSTDRDVFNGSLHQLKVLATDPGEPAVGHGRIGGQDRYATAAKLFVHRFKHPSAAVLTRGDTFPDALSANYLAARLHTGVLLTRPRGIPQATHNAIVNACIDTVYIVGGRSAVSDRVGKQLHGTHVCGDSAKRRIHTVRLGGPDRYATNRRVNLFGATKHVDTVLMATGAKFPDALALGPVGYANQLPLILTAGHTLTRQVKRQLNAFDPKTVVIAGESDVVPRSVARELRALDYAVVRLGGHDRTLTAGKVARWSTEGIDRNRDGDTRDRGEAPDVRLKGSWVFVANGRRFPDALTGAPYAATTAAGSAIVLTRATNTIGRGIRHYLARKSAGRAKTGRRVSHVEAIGGGEAISGRLLAVIATEVGG